MNSKVPSSAVIAREYADSGTGEINFISLKPALLTIRRIYQRAIEIAMRFQILFSGKKPRMDILIDPPGDMERAEPIAPR
jgi:hypothetical protein